MTLKHKIDRAALIAACPYNSKDILRWLVTEFDKAMISKEYLIYYDDDTNILKSREIVLSAILHMKSYSPQICGSPSSFLYTCPGEIRGLF